MLLSSSFLRFKPSSVAAAALMLSININCSPSAQLMGAPDVLGNQYAKSFFYNQPEPEDLFEEHKGEPRLAARRAVSFQVNAGPLQAWNQGVSDMTNLTAEEHI